MTISEPTIVDEDLIREVYLKAFGREERQVVADLACELLRSESSPGTLHLVAERAGELVGHIAFSPVWMDGGNLVGYILAPLAVEPNHQKCGVGKGLVEEGMRRLSSQGVDWVFVYGDPAFYGRFGFCAELAQKFIPPYPLTHPIGWQVMNLHGKKMDSPSVSIECVPAHNNEEIWSC